VLSRLNSIFFRRSDFAQKSVFVFFGHFWGAGAVQLKKNVEKMVFGGLSVWTLADCEWRAAAAGLRLPHAPGDVETRWLGWWFLDGL